MAAKFELVSKFQPAGDQPQAIDKLVSGFQNGSPCQTLLGATGTGKSLAWDEPVLVRRLTEEGRWRSEVAFIGQLVDAAFQTTLSSSRGATEVISPPRPILVYSFNPKTCAAEWRPVSALSRHHTPTAMYRVRTACGREVVVTGDHNFVCLRNGELRVTETASLGRTDYIPLPDALDLPDQDLTRLDLLEVLADASHLQVFAKQAFDWIVDRAGWPAVREVLKPYYPRNLYAKRYALRRNGKKTGIVLPAFRELLRLVHDQLPEDLPLRIGRWDRSDAHFLPRWLPVTEEFLGLLGHFLAEGHWAGEAYLLFSCHEELVREDFLRCAATFGLRPGIRLNSDMQITSVLWATLMSRLVGGTSRDKHLPPFWTELSRVQLAVLLRAYYEGDGGIERPMVCASTSSMRLASELGYALVRFGVWARLHRRWKRATNSGHAGDWYHSVSISGQTNLARFAESIGFLTTRKRDALNAQLGLEENTNVDVIPLGASRLRRLREAAGWSKKRLQREGGTKRSLTYLTEKGARHLSRSSVRRLLGALGPACLDHPDLRPLVREAEAFLKVRWTPVASVRVVEETRPYVYDFSVPDNETFLAGHGGMFVHNTFTASHVIAKLAKPTLVLAHNKTLAAQLYKEFRSFFPRNAVAYFVSYYDYYQPEAYIPQRDIYIEKDALINENIDRLRLAATSALVSREDVIIVASVSCIYGLGSPSDYKAMMVRVVKGEAVDRDNLLLRLVDIQYQRNDIAFERGKFRVRGDVVEVWPAYEEFAFRIELFGDDVESMAIINPTSGETLRDMEELYIYPAKHFVTPDERIRAAVDGIRGELDERLKGLKEQGKLLEAQRLQARTNYDIEMLLEAGHCNGIENYSRWLTNRKAGEPPDTLMSFFPDDFLMIVDESHATLPQVRGMFAGDHSRKTTLVEHGFRLPSALDNRPLRFDEWEKRVGQVLFMSATPAAYELERCGGEVVEQVIRPTGLVDPLLHVRPALGQVPDLMAEIRKRTERGERTLVTTLTKRLAEDLSNYFREAGLRCKWLHSELDAIERIQILRELREGAFDVLVGVNLLREGLDLPEVSLVAILDADKEGFLRSGTSLIQTIGRAARNVNAEVILYADKVTPSMQMAMDETKRRRELQLEYNKKHGITPETVKSAIKTGLEEEIAAHKFVREVSGEKADDYVTQEYLEELHGEMLAAAANLEFERAAELRDRISQLKGQPTMTPQAKKPRGRRKGRG